MKERRPIIRVVWGIDPFEKGDAPIHRMGLTLRHLLHGSLAEITPTYIVSADAWRTVVMTRGSWRGWVHRLATDTLHHRLDRLGLPGLAAPAVLWPDSDVVRGAAGTLTRQARRSHADFIAITTHARRGMRRLLLGSFAETMLLSAGSNLLVINPSERPPARRTVLFATDLTAASREALRRFAGYARRWHVKVIVFHQVPIPMIPHAEPWSTYSLGLEDSLMVAALRNDRAVARRRVKEFVRIARAAGARATGLVTSDLGGITEAILTAARRRGAGYIAIGAHAHRVPSLLGSVARQVVRQSRLPVLVLSP